MSIGTHRNPMRGFMTGSQGYSMHESSCQELLIKERFLAGAKKLHKAVFKVVNVRNTKICGDK